MKQKKLWIFAAVVLLIFLLNRRYGWSDVLSPMENLELLEEVVQKNRLLAFFLYLVLTVIGSVVLALPGVTFAIVAGMMFGPVWGTAACAAASTLGAMLAFVAGRFFLKDSIKPLAMKNPYLKKWLFDETGGNEVFVLMITRLVPLFPYNLQNFAYGITDIRFSTYSLWSFLFMIPGTAMYTVGTAGILSREHRWLYLGITALLAVTVLGVGAFLKKRFFSDGE